MGLKDLSLFYYFYNRQNIFLQKCFVVIFKTFIFAV
jgi:hypothetical protein